jgi:hypothetical protein
MLINLKYSYSGLRQSRRLNTQMCTNITSESSVLDKKTVHILGSLRILKILKTLIKFN